MNIKLGLRVLYRPRVPYGRQSELFCFITRVVREDDGVVDLIGFPANSEPQHYNSVARRSDTISVHCWEPVEDEGAQKLDERISLLEMRPLAADMATNAGIAALQERLDALEKRLASPKAQGQDEGRKPAQGSR